MKPTLCTACRHILSLLTAAAFSFSPFALTPAHANDAHFGEIQLAENLQQDGQQSSTNKKPIVLFITASYCSFCETLREEVFQFFPKDPRFILREVVIDSEFPVKSFNGKDMNHGVLSKQLHAPLTPTVLFVDDQGGQIAEPLVGVLTLDFYNYYFEENLAAASQALKP